MAKKSDRPTYLASSAAGSIAAGRLPYVPGAILERSSASPEPSQLPAAPLPPRVWPQVDDYLDEPDEVNRWERIGEERREASPATADHGDPHFELDALLKAHLAAGYVGSVDLKTRINKKREYASDTCVRRAGIDPATGRRYLEELVFEVVYKRSKKDTKTRAEGFAARGVDRQIGIFVREETVHEWLKSKGDWGPPLDLGRGLRAPCLAVPLPLAALFDPVLAGEAATRALEAKDDPVILEIKEKSEARGEMRGETRGETRGRAEALLTVLSARGFGLSGEVRERILATIDRQTLERWLRRAAAASSLDEVLVEV